MSNINITLPAYLTASLTPPLCAEFALPAPPSELPAITLPTGATLTGIADFTRGIPSNCAMNFSLVAMIAPIMASIECPLKILKLIGDLINAAKTFDPMKLLSALTDAEQALQSCLALATPSGICPFVKSVLLLVVSMLNCFLQELASEVALMNGLSANIAAAAQSGNTEMVSQLNCAMQNAQNTAAGTLTSIQPIAALLQVGAPILAMLNVNLVLPDISGGTTDMAGLQQVIQTLTPIVATIQTTARSLPC